MKYIKYFEEKEIDWNFDEEETISELGLDDRVYHIRYGWGKIVDIRNVWWGVEFDKKYGRFHSCQGKGEIGYCCYVSKNDIYRDNHNNESKNINWENFDIEEESDIDYKYNIGDKVIITDKLWKLYPTWSTHNNYKNAVNNKSILTIKGIVRNKSESSYGKVDCAEFGGMSFYVPVDTLILIMKSNESKNINWENFDIEEESNNREILYPYTELKFRDVIKMVDNSYDPNNPFDYLIKTGTVHVNLDKTIIFSSKHTGEWKRKSYGKIYMKNHKKLYLISPGKHNENKDIDWEDFDEEETLNLEVSLDKYLIFGYNRNLNFIGFIKKIESEDRYDIHLLDSKNNYSLGIISNYLLGKIIHTAQSNKNSLHLEEMLKKYPNSLIVGKDISVNDILKHPQNWAH